MEQPELKPLKLRINSFYGIKGVSIDVSKTILYGPNEAGKSRIMYALLFMLHHDSPPSPYRIEESDRVRELEEGIDLEVEFRNSKLRFQQGFYSCGGQKASYESLAPCIMRFYDPIKSYAIFLYDGSVAYGEIGKSPRTIDSLNVKELLKDPAVVEEMTPAWSAYTRAQEFYYDKVKIAGKWVDPGFLSYGAKRTIMLQYLVWYYDLVLVETFESGLHADLLVELMEYIHEYGKYVVIETHNGMMLRRALELGWKVYYVDKGKITEITSENLTNIELFRSELEAYGG